MMYPTRNQRTIASPATVRGIGYWSGRDVRVEFRPAEADTGIVFIRDDLEGCPQIAATIENWTETELRTTLRCSPGSAGRGTCPTQPSERRGNALPHGQVGVDMVEHVMAALAGLQIDNCQLWVDQAEMPGCDGSSLPFVEALSAAGIVEQNATRRRRIVRQIVRLGNRQSWIEARPCCSGQTVLAHELDYGHGNPVGRQSLEIALSPESFCKVLAPSRTFVFQKEAALLQARGLGKKVTCRDLLVFGPDGPIDNQLRFADECVRHKLLDMVGDLALAGCDLVGRFVAYRSGHRLNAELVRAILDQGEAQQGLKRCA